MFYQQILSYVYKHIASNIEIDEYKNRINKFVKSNALMQLFDSNSDENICYICLIRDDNYNYYFIMLNKDFNYICHSVIYDTVYNYIKLSEFIKYNESNDIYIDYESNNDNIYNCVKSKMNILLLKTEYTGNKLLFVKLNYKNYIFSINDENRLNQIKILKYKEI
jgi:hypothetical protein